MKPADPGRGYQVVDVDGVAHWVSEGRRPRRRWVLRSLLLMFVVLSTLAAVGASLLPTTQSSSSTPSEQYTVRTLAPRQPTCATTTK